MPVPRQRIDLIQSFRIGLDGRMAFAERAVAAWS